jgi:hypothetical protein
MRGIWGSVTSQDPGHSAMSEHIAFPGSTSNVAGSGEHTIVKLSPPSTHVHAEKRATGLGHSDDCWEGAHEYFTEDVVGDASNGCQNNVAMIFCALERAQLHTCIRRIG